MSTIVKMLCFYTTPNPNDAEGKPTPPTPCPWEASVDMANITESIPTGTGKLSIMEYAGNDKSNDYKITLCPTHTKALLANLDMEVHAKKANH